MSLSYKPHPPFWLQKKNNENSEAASEEPSLWNGSGRTPEALLQSFGFLLGRLFFCTNQWLGLGDVF